MSELALIYHALVEEVANSHVGELARSKPQFENRRGKVYEDEELWESASACFIDWFIVEHNYPDDAPPVVEYARKRESAQLWALAVSHRSVFELELERASTLELLDLINGGHFSVDIEEQSLMLEPGDAFEARLCGLGERIVFSPAMFFHPPGVAELISRRSALMKQSGHSRRDIMDLLANLRIRAERYGHKTVAEVYAEGVIP